VTIQELHKHLSEAYRDDYYALLLTHYLLILKEVRKTNQRTVAQAIGMKEPQFSAIHQLLLAYFSEKNLEEALR